MGRPTIPSVRFGITSRLHADEPARCPQDTQLVQHQLKRVKERAEDKNDR